MCFDNTNEPRYESIKIPEFSNEILARKGIVEQIKNTDQIIHLILIGTKPDIIKQAPLINELKKQKKFTVVVHSGQHYDWNLSGGLEKEFNIKPDFNLQVRGSLYEQQAQIIGKLGFLLKKFFSMNKNVIPYPYGDTTTSVAAGISSYLNDYAVAHVEAGLRTMTPEKRTFLGLLNNFDVNQYFEELKTTTLWQKGSYEPFPEQFNTRVSAPSAGIHFAPTILNEKHLLDEGFHSDRLFVVGNPVVDAINYVKKKKIEDHVFNKYPKLEEGNFIRVCIHRRENITSKHRFSVLIKAIINLVESGENVLFISLGGTEKALIEFGLKNKLIELSKKRDNLIFSSVWPYYSDVIAAMKKCTTIATDSGSIQEEANILNIPGVILRFNTDRPETVFEGSNILAPPIKSEIVEKIIKAVHYDESLRKKNEKH